MTDKTTQNETTEAGSLPDAASESGTSRDGAFSYAAEWHAFTHGVFLGLTTKPWKTPPTPNNADVRKENHYYRGGYVLATLLQLALIAAGLWGSTFALGGAV